MTKETDNTLRLVDQKGELLFKCEIVFVKTSK